MHKFFLAAASIKAALEIQAPHHQLSSVYLLLLFSHHLIPYPMASSMLSAFKDSSTLKLHMTIVAHLWLWPVALFALDLLYIAAASDRIEGLAERTYFYVGGR